MKLSTARHTRPTISLVAMIDVLMIMLIFFMVTSTYLNLDMIPMAERGDGETQNVKSGEAGRTNRVLIRLGSDGVPYVGGQPMDGAGLFDLSRQRLQENALAEFLILPELIAADVPRNLRHEIPRHPSWCAAPRRTGVLDERRRGIRQR